MKCPNCGCEIPDGYLYCEKCGSEIQMVPDFEPEIENSIIETLSTVAEEIEGGSLAEKIKEHKKPKDSLKKTEQKEKKAKKKKETILPEEPGKNWLLASLISFVAVILTAALVSIYLYHKYSFTYQIKKAREYAQSQDYEMAVAYLERARALNADVKDIDFLESNYYYHLGEKQKAVDVLQELLDRGHLEFEDREEVYASMVTIYDEEKKYEEINALLLSCKDDVIVNQYQKYMAMEPEFGYISGSYDEVITLKLSANTTGTIYYTLDGKEPDEKSMVYTAPLFLESGTYQIAAVFVNEYGIRSKTARNWYVINLIEPDPPELRLYSGDYHQPTMIEVAVPEKGIVYYTSDGSNPTADSARYTGPIPMPLGRSNFKFVTISSEGVSSEIVSRSFDFTLQTDMTPEKAVDNVVLALYNREVLTDLQGHSIGVAGKYVFQFDTIVEIPDLGYYYILNEYVEDELGNQAKTEHLYAVEVYTGAPNRLVYDENGKMGLIPLQ